MVTILYHKIGACIKDILCVTMRRVNYNVWNTNCVLIEQRFPEIYAVLQLVAPLPLHWVQSRSHHWVAAFADTDKVWHSQYAPEQEYTKLAQTHSSESILFWGVGCGYQLLPFVRDTFYQRLLIVESSPALAKAILMQIDCTEWLQDSRIQWLLAPSYTQWQTWLQQYYHPLWQGNLSSVYIHAVIEHDKSNYQQYQSWWNQYQTSLAGDLSSQGYFAQRWFKNITTNLLHCYPQKDIPILPQGHEVAIIGAGVSLQYSYQALKSLQARGGILIATDATLASLSAHHIIPQYVISLDAQALIHWHFIGLNPQSHTQWFCDIASSPSLVQKQQAHLFAGGHPLGRLAGLAALDTRGGHVGYAALALAHSMKPSRLYRYGFDFVYPQGKPYAMGVTWYHQFLQQAHRTSPYYHQSLQLLWRYKNIQRCSDGSYQPMLFRDYQKSFESLWVHGLDTLFVPNRIDGSKFLGYYAQQLKQLKVSQAMQQWDSLVPFEKHMWYTMAPLLASWSGQYTQRHTLLQVVLDWSIQNLEAIL